MLQVSNGTILLWAVLLLLLPLKWLLAAAAAAVVHEACHVAVVLLFGGRVQGIYLRPLGAVIETEGISGVREAVCALAGPAGSLLLSALIHYFPTLGFCGLVQGIFNLLPVYPLDGGRAILRLLERLWPGRAERIARLVEICVFGGLAWFTLFLSIRHSFGISLVVFYVLVFAKALLRKKP